ncbi:hypothetical protein AAHA92_33548 [Salvia divinorum]|uniref:Uncharacterized protein n=1 Tax=Salvia divinorum TaxID=28513 RepID=A0ABD1FSE9_SALDI
MRHDKLKQNCEEEESDDDDYIDANAFREYTRIVCESYDCTPINSFFYHMIYPEHETRYEEIGLKYVVPAIDNYNKEHNRKLVLDSIEKVNTQPSGIVRFFITFKVKDMDDGGALKTFQCRIFSSVGETDVEQFREKPTTKMKIDQELMTAARSFCHYLFPILYIISFDISQLLRK